MFTMWRSRTRHARRRGQDRPIDYGRNGADDSVAARPEFERRVSGILVQQRGAIARGAEYLIRTTLAGLERRLDPQRFVRIHRSVIVNADRVAEIRSDAHGDFDVTLAGGKVLRMTRNFWSG
jgi:hypothetical protein